MLVWDAVELFSMGLPDGNQCHDSGRTPREHEVHIK